MRTILRHWVLCFSIVACGWHISFANAAGALPEYTVKAGYLYNFAMLTEWPANSLGASLELCYLGHEDLGAALDALQDKVVNNRRINIRRLEALSDAKECQVLFVSEVGHSDVSKLMREIAGRPVLTVTDDENAARAGMAIFLRPESKRLVFEINNNVAKSVNLNISARLLRLARGGGSE